MEPSHKDAETAAAAAAVAAAAAADRGTSSSSGVVVQVREKKGPLRAAIPYMPFPVAVICLFLNTFVPGLDRQAEVSPKHFGERDPRLCSEIFTSFSPQTSDILLPPPHPLSPPLRLLVT
ncbi:protein stum homolog isoform X6 [Physeter macrocephalus]|uniref:Protein stum homolog isoform X6 n=1 Tax=Physeter macrocephalus TaxID=9755 RepID=A0A455B872_PHYMC|nr:protein stum homolog isoform X6 [Physeter catodon]|eukprot:XP_028344188.1 protein stum homolog isoform X5 [Physeter catodon]